MALATAAKGTSTISEYYTKMKSLADEMASAGKKLEDEELVSYILTGLGEDFDGVITVVSTHVEPITVNELYAHVVTQEQHIEMHGGGQHTTNITNKGGHGSPNNRGGGCGGHSGFECGQQKVDRGGVRSNNFKADIFCQVCGKEGHQAYRYYKRFDHSVS
jgi:hypothetical protein